MTASLVVDHARIATCAGSGEDRLGTIDDGAVAIDGDRIAWIGPSAQLPAAHGSAPSRIDAGGRLITPGLVDPHTHLVFAGSRAAEFEKKMAGVDYRTIAAEGGGILSTVRATRAASDEELRALARSRLRAALERGVTTVEVKSGYGLSLEDELRLLRVARSASEGESPMPRVTTTLLGAHAVPPEHAGDRAGYVRLVAGEMVERAAKEGLADACDVYLDENAFTADEARTILSAAKAAGLRVRAHVGQFADVGGAELLSELGGLSCDHLEAVGDAGLAAMAAKKTRAVLLPGAWRTLRQKAPDAQRILAAGVRIAVGTDLNPGTSPTIDLPLMAALAVRDAGLPASEALLAMTVEAAAACGDGGAGRLSAGGPADLVLWDHDDPRVFAYALGAVRASLVVVGGRIALDQGGRPPVVA